MDYRVNRKSSVNTLELTPDAVDILNANQIIANSIRYTQPTKLRASFSSPAITLSATSLTNLTGITGGNLFYTTDGTFIKFPVRGIYLIEILFSFTVITSANVTFDIRLLNNDTGVANDTTNFVTGFQSGGGSRPSDRARYCATYDNTIQSPPLQQGMTLQVQRVGSNISNWRAQQMFITLINQY